MLVFLVILQILTLIQ